MQLVPLLSSGIGDPMTCSPTLTYLLSCHLRASRMRGVTHSPGGPAWVRARTAPSTLAQSPLGSCTPRHPVGHGGLHTHCLSHCVLRVLVS